MCIELGVLFSLVAHPSGGVRDMDTHPDLTLTDEYWEDWRRPCCSQTGIALDRFRA